MLTEEPVEVSVIVEPAPPVTSNPAPARAPVDCSMTLPLTESTVPARVKELPAPASVTERLP